MATLLLFQSLAEEALQREEVFEKGIKFFLREVCRQNYSEIIKLGQSYKTAAYSPCMLGMHCMPSYLAKKENNNLNKYMEKFKA